MTTFSVVISCDVSSAEAVEIECASPTEAIGEARSFLAELVDRLDEDVAEVSATVGEGGLGEDPEWLGVWEWSQRCGWRWAPRGIKLA